MKQEQEIFEQAMALPSREAREAYLLGACGQNRDLRRSVDELLAAFNDAGKLDFLKAGKRSQETLTALVDTRLDEGPGTVIGRYKLLQQIGEGGCGVVYMAEQAEPVRRRVALKVIKLGMDTKSVIARFEAERQALALMDHPNIAKVLDAGATEAGRPYFVMELVRGVKITDYCDQNNLSTHDRLDLFIKVCQAIQHAHQKGIIHRDIKPSNVLVTLHDGVAVPKVIDFGIAKATTDQRLTDKTLFTALEQFIGTPAYMSPEQAEMSGLDIDTRCDIYSLGVLLYELLTGSTPFDAKELMAAGIDAMRKTIREQEPVRPSTRLTQDLVAASRQSAADSGGGNGGALPRRRYGQIQELIHILRGDLDWIVMKCLEKDRGRRYETANGLAADLKRHLGNEPVVARPPSAAYRLQKAWRRNKLAFAAGTAVAAALVIGIVVSGWQAFEASRARNAEKQQRLAAQAAQNKAESAQQAEQQERLRADVEKTEARRYLYMAQMNLAQQAWEQNNLGRLRQLLEETQESPNRGFEWYYWQRQTHLPLKTLRGHLEDVTSVDFSPDGRQIVTGSWDQTAKVWEAASGRVLRTLEGHSGRISSVAFSPDGQRIVTGSDDNTAKVWEAASGRELLPLKGHNGGILSVAFSPNGQRIVTGSRDQMAKVWEAASAVQVAAWQKEDNTAAERRLAVLGQERAAVAEPDRLRRAQDAGAIRHVTFTKWATSLPANPPSSVGIYFAGVVGGDVGSGRLAGEVFSDSLIVTRFWLGHARYEFYGEKHSFIADIHVTENHTTDPATAVITGVVTQGWRKGAQLTGEYTVMPVSPIKTPGNVFGTLCFQGTLHIDGGSEQ